MRTVEVNVFEFEELDDNAKEKAREWWRDGGAAPWWDEATLEDFKNVCDALGIEIGTQGANGPNHPAIYYDLNCNEYGASFDGTWTYKADAEKAVAEYAPKDTVLRRIAKGLATVGAKHKDMPPIRIGTEPSWTRHAMCLHQDDADSIADFNPEEVMEYINLLCVWLRDQLDEAAEYWDSDEAIDETIIGNEYEFTVTGRRFVEGCFT